MIDKTIAIAKEAGVIIREGFRSNISIEFKTDEANLVTNIDKAAEKVITDFIKKEFPTHSILAEESGESDKNSEYKWVIDPIDGTTNFAHGLPYFCVSIGILKNEEIICGVVYDVMRDVIYSAEKGSGAFEDGKRLKVSNNSNLARSVLVTGFAYERGEKYTEALNLFSSFMHKTRAVRRLGSAALDFCYVASGVFDGFWEANISPWDVCAGMILVDEAGGKLTNYNNQSIDIYSEQFLASNILVHDEMIKIIQETK